MKNKNQNQDQQKQAAHAVTIFYEIRRPHSEKEDGVKKETRKNKDLQPQKTTEKLLRNVDWISDYIPAIQELLEHSDALMTMIYTHTIQSQTIKEAKSPVDF